MTGRGEILRLAIVNRGESALRCVRAVKSLRAAEGSDMRAIALYTPVDRDAPFVRHADFAIALILSCTPCPCQAIEHISPITSCTSHLTSTKNTQNNAPQNDICFNGLTLKLNLSRWHHSSRLQGVYNRHKFEKPHLGLNYTFTIKKNIYQTPGHFP